MMILRPLQIMLINLWKNLKNKKLVKIDSTLVVPMKSWEMPWEETLYLDGVIKNVITKDNFSRHKKNKFIPQVLKSLKDYWL